jgi:hypothetical protein
MKMLHDVLYSAMNNAEEYRNLVAYFCLVEEEMFEFDIID